MSKVRRISGTFRPGRGGPTGPVSTFAGEWDTNVGLMVVRVDGDRARGNLPGVAFEVDRMRSGDADI